MNKVRHIKSHKEPMINESDGENARPPDEVEKAAKRVEAESHQAKPIAFGDIDHSLSYSNSKLTVGVKEIL